MTEINSLPNEIFVKIFHYLQTENQHEFINCFFYVCRKWREAAKDSSFFEILDGSLPLDTIAELAKAGSLQRTKVLKFSRPTEAKKSLFRIMYADIPLLKRIDLTNVSQALEDIKTKHIFFTELKGQCPNLCELALRDSEGVSKEDDAVYIFKRMISIIGPNLVVLDFSCLTLVDATYMFEHIANNCPNLEELFAQYLRCDSLQLPPVFSIEKMQNGCPKLKTLQSGYPVSYRRGFGEGFPNLEIFVHSCKGDFEFESSTLWELLCKSPNLKVLDFRNCPMVSYEVLDSLPAINLQHIYISHILNESSYFKIFQKWSHSLIVIYVSHLKTSAINRIQDLCLPNGFPNLEIFAANYTLITVNTLKFVIEQSPKLRFLDLRDSYCLKKEKAIVYRSRSEVEDLLAKLREIK